MTLIDISLAAWSLFILAPAALGQQPSKRTDKYGDPLPAGAMARLGTNRLSSAGILSPDGKVLACFSVLEVRLFDVQSGKPLRSWQHDKPGYGSLAFSPDGQILALACGSTIQLRKPHSGELIRQWQGHKEFVRALVFSPDGKTLATSSMDKSIRLWDPGTGKLLHQLDGSGQGGASSLAFAPDGKTLASASHQEGTIRLWNVASGKESAKLQPRGINSAVLFSPDGEILIHAGWNDGFIRYWHIGQAQEIKQIPTDRGITGLAMNADGTFLIATGDQGVIRIWDRESGAELGQVRATTGKQIARLSMDRKGDTLATANYNSQRCYLWRITKQGKNFQLAKLHVFDGHDGPIEKLAFSCHGKYLLSTGYDRTIRLWDPDTGKELHQFFGGQFDATADLSSDGDHLAYASTISECSIFDIAAGKLVRKFKTPTHPRALALSPDNRTLVYCGSDATIYLAETATGKTRAAFKAELDLQHLVLSHDGYTLAGSTYRETSLWDLIAGKELARWSIPDPGKRAFSADGALCATAYRDPTLRRWNLTGKEITDSKKALRGVLHFAYFPDGQTVATNVGKQATVLRDVASGKVVHQLPGEYAPLAVSPDGRTLATGDGNAILLWAMDAFVKGDPVTPVGLSEKELAARLSHFPARPWNELWSDLAAPDAQKAYQALWGMVAQARETEMRLPKLLVQFPTRGIKAMIADLGHADAKRRVAAEQDLEQLGILVEPALRQALDYQLMGDARSWIERHLARREKRQGPDEGLRLLRAVEILEHLATPQARQILQALAKAGPEETQRMVQASLTRLKKR